MPALAKNPDKNQPDTPTVAGHARRRADRQGLLPRQGPEETIRQPRRPRAGQGRGDAAAQLEHGVLFAGQTFIRIRKLEIRRFNQYGIVCCNGSESLVQDNFVHHCGLGINCGERPAT